ncbi:MAG: hypothetical protein FWE66_00790 [Oscillospiraceae bacterium]|nr:hypothetical protein [Oscillospiraceae bacterium]
MLLISGIRISFEEPNEAAVEKACSTLNISDADISSFRLRKLSYDARHGTLTKVCSVILELRNPLDEKKLAGTIRNATLYSPVEFSLRPGKNPMDSRPVVVGFGPAGMFAALALAEYGYRPIVLERGQDADSRKEKVAQFYSSGTLDQNSNVQFGEGGAGLFSDGKLTTRTNDVLCDYVLRTFTEHGADDKIIYEAKPHLGSDVLADIVKRIRGRIIGLGGEVRFESRVDDIAVRAGRLVSLTTGRERIPVQLAIFAVGHSARDMTSLLMKRGADVTAKSFAVGLRIEHLQSDIDRSLWGKNAGNPLLPKGEYALSTTYGGRPVYTFCMCPGGSVVAAASGRGEVVVNGMSSSLRDGRNANGAVVASVDESEFGGDPLLCTAFQAGLEQEAYRMGGGLYAAPASDVGSFLGGKAGLKSGRVEPSYPLGVTAADLGKLLGPQLADSIRFGILEFSDKIRGFDSEDAILTGVESRTSSPVRVLRREDRQAIGIENLYPCGEGAGYAGGIMSSAVDGLRTAAAIIEKYRPAKG